MSLYILIGSNKELFRHPLYFDGVHCFIGDLGRLKITNTRDISCEERFYTCCLLACFMEQIPS